MKRNRLGKPGKNSAGLRTRILHGLAFLAPFLAAGVVGYGMINKPSPSVETANAAVFDRVWYLVSRNYFDDTFGGVDWNASREEFRPLALAARNAGELYNRAIWPMLDQIKTSHLQAISPGNGPLAFDTPYHFSNSRGDAISDYGGPGDLGGLDAVFDGARWVVYGVRENSEAAKNGVEPEDILASVRVRPIRDGNAFLYEAKLGLTAANGQAKEISYRYKPRFVIPQRTTTTRPTGAVVVRFDAFGKETIDWALEQIKEAEPAPLILDLRENRGGNIGQMLRIGSALMPNRASLGVSKGRMFPHTFNMWTRNDSVEYGGPIAVLIGPKTASAGEMLSHALHAQIDAPLVGERTAGAVLTARDWKLPDGGKLVVATGDFLTADNQRLEGVGVSPTIEAAQTLDAIREGRDLVIEAAEQALLLSADEMPPDYAISPASGP